MANVKICPFFARDEEYCDVGCGYISTYDVNLISKYCSCRFTDCQKYHELVDRLSAPVASAG